MRLLTELEINPKRSDLSANEVWEGRSLEWLARVIIINGFVCLLARFYECFDVVIGDCDETGARSGRKPARLIWGGLTQPPNADDRDSQGLARTAALSRRRAACGFLTVT